MTANGDAAAGSDGEIPARERLSASQLLATPVYAGMRQEVGGRPGVWEIPATEAGGFTDSRS